MLMTRVSTLRLASATAVIAWSLSASLAEAQSESVLVARDGHGTAHVSAASDEGAFYGAGWAQAEDRLFQMCLMRVIYQGRVAEFFGAAPPGSAGEEYVQLDRYHRRLGWSVHALREDQNLSPELKGLLDAFAEGVTDYMVEVRNGSRPKHPLFDATNLPLDEDWTARDTLGVWLRMASAFRKIEWNEPARRFEIDALLGMGKTQQEIIDEEFTVLCDDDAAVVQQQDVDPALLAAMTNYAAAKGLSNATNCAGLIPPPPHFSHAWAVGASKVVEGVSVLMSDPRLAVSVPNTLYEWHMIGDTFDARGAGIPGVPYMLVGSNAHVAWGATALGPDQADLFRMDVNLSTQPAKYLLDYEDGMGPQVKNMTERPSDIKVLGGGVVPVVYRETYYGPLVTEFVTLADQQTLGPNEGYSLKALPWSHPTLSNLQGYLDMYRSTDVVSFRAALEGVIFPAINMVFADSAGSIGYVANGGFPVRTANEFLAGYAAVDGSTVANDWQELLPHDFKPWVIDPADGVLFSANHRPIGSFYPLPFVSGAVGDGRRSWRLRQLLETGGPLTIDEIAQVHLSATPPVAVGVTEVAQAMQAIDASFPADLRAQAALGHLASWLASGGEMTNVHPATYLAGEVDIRFPSDPVTMQPLAIVAIYGGKGVIPFLKTKLAEIGGGAFTANSDEKRAIELLLALALERTVTETGSSNPATWQNVYEAQKLTNVYTLADDTLGNAPWTVPDRYRSLAGTDVDVTVIADVTMPSFPHGHPRCTERGTIMEQAGQSFTQLVLPGIPNASLSVLTPGVREFGTPGTPNDISSNPASTGVPIDRNQEPLWSGIGSGAATDLKWSPTTASGVTQLTGGFLSVDTLTYTP